MTADLFAEIAIEAGRGERGRVRSYLAGKNWSACAHTVRLRVAAAKQLIENSARCMLEGITYLSLSFERVEPCCPEASPRKRRGAPWRMCAQRRSTFAIPSGSRAIDAARYPLTSALSSGTCVWRETRRCMHVVGR